MIPSKSVCGFPLKPVLRMMVKQNGDVGGKKET
jgi:hypothetical protein